MLHIFSNTLVQTLRNLIEPVGYDVTSLYWAVEKGEDEGNVIG